MTLGCPAVRPISPSSSWVSEKRRTSIHRIWASAALYCTRTAWDPVKRRGGGRGHLPALHLRLFRSVSSHVLELFFFLYPFLERKRRETLKKKVIYEFGADAILCLIKLTLQVCDFRFIFYNCLIRFLVKMERKMWKMETKFKYIQIFIQCWELNICWIFLEAVAINYLMKVHHLNSLFVHLLKISTK